MSDKTEKPDGDGGWVPSAEHPVPPTTEFNAIPAEAVEPISGTSTPDEVEAEPATGSAPQSGDAEIATDASADVPADEEPVTSGEPEDPSLGTPEAAAAATGGTPPIGEAPAWKTPPAAGLPPQWGDPDAQASAKETGPQPENGVANLWGLAPEDRPEVALGAALAAGVLTAIVFRTLARR